MDVRRVLARLRALLLDSSAAEGSPTTPLASAGSVSQHEESNASVSPRPADTWHARKPTVANWLADGRRVRLRVRLNARQGGALDECANANQMARHDRVDRQDVVRPASARITAPREPIVQGFPMPSTPTADGAAHSRTAASSTAPSSPALPPDIRVDFTGELSAATLAAIEQLDATQRRLIFLRYLVEQGVYNEGFGSHPLPEQYWRSRGRGEQPSE